MGLFFLLLFFSSSLSAGSCTISFQQENAFLCLNTLIPDSLFIKKITSNVQSLVEDLSEDTMSSRRAIVQIIKVAIKIKKFDSVVVACTPVPGGYALSFDFALKQIFSHVFLSGIFWGKEHYARWYSLAPGDFFDMTRHKQSVKKIQSLLHDEGYCDALVYDVIKSDAKTGLVTVYLKIIRGKRFTISQVHVTSNEKEIEKKLSKKIAILRKASYSKILIDHVAHELKEYLTRKGYHGSVIRCEKELFHDTNMVRIYFFIECGQKARFEYVGNTFFSSQELDGAIQLFGQSDILIPPLIIAEEIKSLYIKKGFFDVSVSFKEESDGTFFCITEGIRYRVTDYTLQADQFPFDTHIFFKPLLYAYYDYEEYKRCIDACIDYAIENGFWDCACSDHIYTKTNSGTCTNTMTFLWGKQRFLAGVSVNEYPEIVQEPLFARYAVLPQAIPFSLYIVQEQQQWLYNYCQKKGLLYLSARPVFTETPAGIWLTWEFIGEKQPVHFGKTFIVGNSIIPQRYILRELSFKEGDIWNKNALHDSVRKIKNLGVFESVSLNLCDITDNNVTQDVYLKIIEDSRCEFRTRAGALFVSKNFGIRGGWSYMAGASLVWRNPTYRADLARVDVDFSRYKQTVRGMYVQPWFFNMPLKTEYTVYANRYDQPFVVGSRDRLYRLDQDGFLIGWARKLRYWQSGLTVGSEWMRIHKVSTRLARAIDFAPWLIDRWVPYFFAEPSFFLEYLDDKLQPSRGIMTMITAKVMAPYTISRAFFFKILLEQSCFVPLWSTVLALRFRAGHLFNQEFSRIMPNERFYLGGAYSLRGYPPDLVPPLNTYFCNGCEHFVPLGGKSMINMNFELRFPVYKNVYGVLFTDWGALAQKHPAELAAHVVGANGFGIRYNTPVGPLRFDIGWKWKRQIGEPRYAWYLTLGNAF